MSKIAQYLQEHLLGEVTASPEVRKHFAHDASILSLAPAIVVYPRNETDARKAVRFSWQLAERGRLLPVTARGAGSDTSGAAIGSGILLVFTAHMNRILTLDRKKEFVTVEPGVTYDKLEQTLFTHGLFFPPYPSSKLYATIGGGLAKNATGEKSVKYGSTGEYVERLRVVLANGEVIETGPLNKRELNGKLGLSNLEGQIYRGVDGLIEENAELLATRKNRLKVRHNASGYNLQAVKSGSKFDLTPLFVGSEGTLGIITEASLSVVPHNPITKLALVSLNNLNDLHELLPKIIDLKPSILDMVNRAAIEQVTKLNPSHLSGLLGNPKAAVHLFVEFDDRRDGAQKKALNQLKKMVEKADGIFQAAESPREQDRIWKIRHSVSSLLINPHHQRKAVPVAEDVTVPTINLVEFLQKATEIYAAEGLLAPVWGHAGDCVVRMQPLLDLSQVGDRQKLFKISDKVYHTAVAMDGNITASAGDGRVRAPYAQQLYGPELHNLTLKLKEIFDPYGILNPGVKTSSLEDVKALLRSEYNLSRLYEHLPRS
jgi:FAD/FMN-containing dehydrogenase